MSNLTKFNQTITNPRTQEYLQNVLSEKKSSFVNNIIALVANNVKLQECEPMSLMHAGIKATALDLPLDSNLGFAYVIPYKTKQQKTEAQFQIGYKGFIQLAIRSGQFKTINVTEVKEGELIHWDMLSGEVVFQAKPNREELKTIGYAAYFRLTNGFEKTLYSIVESIDKHAKTYSQTYSSKTDWVQKSSKWNTDFDAMAKKTVLKLLLSKYAPLSVEMRDAITSDQAIIEGENKLKYVDNESIEESVAEEIETNANKISLSFDEAQEVEEEREKEKVASKQTSIEKIPEEFR
ncbi:MAG: recombinase RecT [Bacteroidales bacterium]